MSNPEDYHVGWICALSTEYVAAQALLDNRHKGPPDYVSTHDNNDYTLGKIGKHNIVIAVMPDGEYGTASAAGVARDMLHSFPNIRIGLMVGIGGGAPSEKNDLRLGDVVVSAPRDRRGGVFQYDFGKTIQNRTFQHTAFLDQPPTVLRTAVNGLKAQYESEGHEIETTIKDVLGKRPRLQKKYGRPEPSSDRLYQSNVVHQDLEEPCAAVCGTDPSTLVRRRERTDEDYNPTIHYGLIASANQLMKDAIARDRLAAENNVLCFEMEAAGVMNHFPCLVVRGICDYSDSHKSKEWQGYAAMTAAAYAKDLLLRISQNRVQDQKKINEVLVQGFSEVNQNVKETKNAVGTLQTNHHLDKVKDWLSPPDCSTNFNKALEQRHAHSGQWLLRSEAYSAWKTDRSSLLWLNGIPGCGKTILSSTVIEDLRSSKSCLRTVLYFYFDFTDTTKQSLNNAIRSLASQLYQKRANTQNCLDSLYSSCEHGRIQPSTQLLVKTFHDMIQRAGEIWIVLDALDECPKRDEPSDNGLLSWIEGLRDSQAIIHTLVTSRPEHDIKSEFTKWARDAEIIPLQNDGINNDINAYIKAKVGEMSRWNSRPDIQKQIEVALIDKANGMFRWASCQFDELGKCLSPSEVLKALATLPPTLDDTYGRILSSIPLSHRPYANRLLQFLSYSERPLGIEEAVDAVAVDLEKSPRFDIRERMPIPAEITRYCSSLTVQVDFRNGRGEMVSEIQLAHFSVKEYLVSDRLEKDVALHLEETNARATITKVCLAYLLDIKSCSLQEVLQKFPFAQYSARYWMDHALKSEKSQNSVVKLAMELFLSEDPYRLCFSLYNPEGSLARRRHTLVQAPMYFASLGGLLECVQQLADTGVDVNARGGLYSNALQAASYGGHREIVQTLLDKGADVNAQGGHYGNALQAASYGGHREIIQTLLDKGADVNAQGGLYSNALQAALYRRHREIVQTLLDKGADVNAQGGHYGNALQAASYGGHREIVQTLLDKEADVNAQGGDYGNALQTASYGGHREIVQTLLDKEANVNAQGGPYSNALQAASYGGHKEIVQTLLDKRADVNAQGGHYSNALQAASYGRHKEIIQTLLDKGADVNAQGGHYGNALQAASYRRHKEIVQTLLDKGADVNAQGGRFGNALQAASYGGHKEIVQTLLDKGADVNAQGGLYSNALQAALYRRYKEIIQTLLDKGADVNAQGGHYGNALQAASYRRHKEIVQTLLDVRANDA